MAARLLPSPPCHQRGMSLLELLVAVAVFAVAAGGLFKVLGESARHTQALESRYFAQQVAHNQLVSLHLQPQWPGVGRSSGKVEFAGREFHWHQVVTATEDSAIRKVALSAGLDKEAPLAELLAFMGEQP